MEKWKLPPKEKIYEAFSVLADNRFVIESNGKASVTSSSGNKQYSLEWIEENSLLETIIKITSNDNASYWQGYLGYPIIAILMVNEKVQFNRSIIEHFKGIQWKALNTACNNNYSKVVEKILANINDEQEIEKIKQEIDNIFNQISDLYIVRLNKKLKPPKD